MDESSAVNILASAARTRQEESIAQRSQRSRRGIRMVDKNSAVDTLASGARTEVNIAQRPTEGNAVLDESSAGEHLGVRRKNSAKS